MESLADAAKKGIGGPTDAPGSASATVSSVWAGVRTRFCGAILQCCTGMA